MVTGCNDFIWVLIIAEGRIMSDTCTVFASDDAAIDYCKEYYAPNDLAFNWDDTSSTYRVTVDGDSRPLAYLKHQTIWKQGDDIVEGV